jgi:hypothetical protein
MVVVDNARRMMGQTVDDYGYLSSSDDSRKMIFGRYNGEAH